MSWSKSFKNMIQTTSEQIIHEHVEKIKIYFAFFYEWYGGRFRGSWKFVADRLR